jgi:two-component system response regulator protein BraR/BceR
MAQHILGQKLSYYFMMRQFSFCAIINVSAYRLLNKTRKLQMEEYNNNRMYKILIIEDDLVIAGSLKKHLSRWGFAAEFAEDFNNIIEQFIQYDPQLILMDISLPFYNGYHWCSEIRKISKVPIIFISSASDNINIVMAVNMGGDDFIAKPFDLSVVVAKVQALLRRAYSFQGQVNMLEHKGAILNLGDATLTYQKQKIDLTKNDFKILQLLLENKGNTVCRDTIMKRLWDSDCFIDDNTLTVNITRLRKKLDEAGLTDFITTKKGIGYLVGD